MTNVKKHAIITILTHRKHSYALTDFIMCHVTKRYVIRYI